MPTSLLVADEERITRLWEEKCGLVEPDDLSTVWPVLMGWTTEDLSLAWFEYKHQKKLKNQQLVIQSKKTAVHALHARRECGRLGRRASGHG